MAKEAGISQKDFDRMSNCYIELKICIEAERMILQQPVGLISRLQSNYVRRPVKNVQPQRRSSIATMPLTNAQNGKLNFMRFCRIL